MILCPEPSKSYQFRSFFRSKFQIFVLGCHVEFTEGTGVTDMVGGLYNRDMDTLRRGRKKIA